MPFSSSLGFFPAFRDTEWRFSGRERRRNACALRASARSNLFGADEPASPSQLFRWRCIPEIDLVLSVSPFGPVWKSLFRQSSFRFFSYARLQMPLFFAATPHIFLKESARVLVRYFAYSESRARWAPFATGRKKAASPPSVRLRYGRAGDRNYIMREMFNFRRQFPRRSKSVSFFLLRCYIAPSQHY